MCLLGIAVVGIAVYADLVSRQPGPFVFLDELAYERMAAGFAHTGHIGLLGKAGLSYSPLYAIVISPIYALTSSAIVAYDWVRTTNVILMASSVFPIYGIARFVLPRRLSLGVAALSLAAPPMLYGALVMSENLAYPLSLTAIWALLRTVRDPGPANDLVFLGLTALASAARLQQIVLVPAALTAIVLVALVSAKSRRTHAAWQSLVRHWVLAGSALVGLVLVLVARLVGGTLPLSGRYANVGTVRPSLIRTAKLFVEHLAELDVAVGVVPFAAAVLGALALRRFGFPRKGLIFGAVALSITTWLVLEVAWDAAGFDSTKLVTGNAAIPRLHERYLIYLVPLFLVALVAALHRARLPVSRYVAAAAVAAVLPATIPFGLVVNNSIVADSFAMGLFAKSGVIYAPVAHATLKAFALAGLLAATLVVAAWRPRRWQFATAIPAIAATLVAFGLISSLVTHRFWLAANGAVSAGVPGQRDWVDRAVPHGHVVLVGGAGGITDLETTFFNLSIDRVYHACGPIFGADFGDHQVMVGPRTSTLEDVEGGTGAVVAPYAVVQSNFGVKGRVLAKDSSTGLVLVAPPTKRLVVREKARAALC